MKTGRFTTLIETTKANNADEIRAALAAANDYDFFDPSYTDEERDAVEAHALATFGGGAMMKADLAAQKLVRFDTANDMMAHLDAFRDVAKDECASTK